MAVAITGRDGWLFLADDSNGSVRQFTGDLKLSQADVKAWRQHFLDADLLSRDLSCNYAFVIAPSKESVYTDYYPIFRKSDPVIEQFRSHFPQCFYPAKHLLKGHEVYPTFSKTNTHWNDWGAYLCAKLLMDQLGQEVSPIAHSEFRVVEGHVGDLGSKMEPPAVSSTIEYPVALSRHMVLNNGIHNHGRLWIYENLDADISGTCLLFGDSFSVNLCKFLSQWFSRLVYLHTTTMDIAIANREKPKLIVSQVAERFLIKPPLAASTFDITDTIASKISATTEDERSRFIEAQREYWPNFNTTFK